MYFRLSLLSAKSNFHFGGDKGQPGKRLRSQARKVFEQLRNVFGLFSVYSLVSDIVEPVGRTQLLVEIFQKRLANVVFLYLISRVLR